MSPKKVEALLYELCADLGFCLSPAVNERLKTNPPASIDEFTETVIREEGLDPNADIQLRMLRDIKTRVAKHFADAENEYFRELEQSEPPPL